MQMTVRCLRLLESTLYGGWKMEALLWIASWLSSALLPPSLHPHLLLNDSPAKEEGKGEGEGKDSPLPTLLAFIPTCYLDLLVDILAAYKACMASSAAASSSRSSSLSPGPPTPKEASLSFSSSHHL